MNSQIKRIQIFGERCSGTSFLNHLVAENLKSVRLCKDFGWKHGFHEAGVEVARDCLFIVIYRNPFDWLRSLHRRPHHVGPTLKKRSFSEFIRTEWWCIWDEDASKTPADELYGAEMMAERNPETGERFADVIDLRTAKIRDWESLRDKVAHSVYVRYEDLAASPSQFIDSLTRRFGLPKPPTFTPIERKRGKRGQYHPKVYKRIRASDLRHIVGRLDAELESSIGYDVATLAADPDLQIPRVLRKLRNLWK